MTERRSYTAHLTINGRLISTIVIDPHYEVKHAESVDDDLIVALVKTLNGRRFEPVKVDEEYEYFVEDQILYEGRYYKLIWLLEEDEVYVGVVNAYRRK